MRRILNPEPYVGQRWTASDSKQFEIVDLNSDNTWVIYRNTQTRDTYSCLLEAFKHRFSPLID